MEILIAILAIVLIMLPKFIRFEKDPVEARESVLIAVFAAIASVGRVLFASIPSVQPTSSIVMLAGYVFGPQVGFMVGAISAIASNMVLGQGPYTILQMFGFGMMGYITGKLGKSKIRLNRLSLSLLGGLFGILFGWFMNIYVIFSLLETINIEGVVSIYLASVIFDLLHAVSNMIIIFIFYNPWMIKMGRIKLKYGL